MMLIVGREPDDAYNHVCLCVLAYSTEFKAVSHAPNRVITEKILLRKYTHLEGKGNSTMVKHNVRKNTYIHIYVISWKKDSFIRIFFLFLLLLFLSLSHSLVSGSCQQR